MMKSVQVDGMTLRGDTAEEGRKEGIIRNCGAKGSVHLSLRCEPQSVRYTPSSPLLSALSHELPSFSPSSIPSRCEFGCFDKKVRVPLVLGIWGPKGMGKTFQTELAFKKLGWVLRSSFSACPTFPI
jgi:hypothetical protein